MADEENRAVRRIEATCRVCRETFSYTYSGGRLKRFCSEECKTQGKQRRVTVATCATCGKGFLPRYVNSGFCSMECRRYPERRVWDSKAEKWQAKRHRRRARFRSAKVERFHAAGIFERDGWRCGICLQKVDKRLKYPNPRSASLDHIIPLASGGHHTRSNVQCSHWICNSRKTNVGGGQLRLDLVCEPA